jgi:hypothetical protein
MVTTGSVAVAWGGSAELASARRRNPLSAIVRYGVFTRLRVRHLTIFEAWRAGNALWRSILNWFYWSNRNIVMLKQCLREDAIQLFEMNELVSSLICGECFTASASILGPRHSYVLNIQLNVIFQPPRIKTADKLRNDWRHLRKLKWALGEWQWE